MKVLVTTLITLLCAFTLPLPAETQADRDLFDGLLRSARELDDRATKLRDRNPGMSDDQAVDRVTAEVRERRKAREAQARIAAPAASDRRETRPESENTGGIVLLAVVGFAVAFAFFRPRFSTPPPVTTVKVQKPSPPPPIEFKFSCPHCDQHILVSSHLTGTSGACPTCGNTLTIPIPT